LDRDLQARASAQRLRDCPDTEREIQILQASGLSGAAFHEPWL
jgi:hypothetical protein